MYKCQKRRNMYDWECGNFAIEKKILKKDETGNIFLVCHVIIKLLILCQDLVQIKMRSSAS